MCHEAFFFDIIFSIKSSYLSLLCVNLQKLAIKQVFKKILNGYRGLRYIQCIIAFIYNIENNHGRTQKDFC